MRNAKRLLRDSLGRTLSEQLDAEAVSFGACAATDDFVEGITAFLEKRPPRFAKPAADGAGGGISQPSATRRDDDPLAGKTLFITGGSRGIGLAIALRAARDGANVAIAAKTTEPNPQAARHDPYRRRGDRGGRRQGAAAARCDIRDEAAGARGGGADGRARFGGIDILVNNASAISLTGTAATPMKRFDLMFGVNVRGTFLCSQACLPHLEARRRGAQRRTS